MIYFAMLTRRIGTMAAGVAISPILSLTSLRAPSPSAHAASPMPPARAEVCNLVMIMPGAEETDKLLALLDTSRSDVVSDLIDMSRNMEQYDAEGYGWQNVIDGSSALEPQPGSWLLGTLKMACKPQLAQNTMTGEIVTPNTYIRAETDFAFANFQQNAGGNINQFYYIRQPTPLDEQPVVRMNRDTLYAAAVVDTEGGATITIPEFPDDRYFSILVIDNDHYAPTVFYEPGTYQIPSDTKYVSLVQRIQLMDPSDPADVALVNELQNQFTIQAASNDLFPDPQWDEASMLALRAEYEQEFQQYDQYEPDWMGPRGEVNEETRHLAVAGAWGLFPEEDAVYINYTGPADPNQCYTATYDVPDNDAFWSITVYGNDGFMKSDNNIVNDRNVELNADGTFTVYFGSQALCGDQPNRVDITEGWNFLMRVYRPGPTILSREYQLPDAEVINVNK